MLSRTCSVVAENESFVAGGMNLNFNHGHLMDEEEFAEHVVVLGKFNFAYNVR